MTPPNVCGLAEAADLLGISKERVRQLRNEHRLPDPQQLESGPVWDRPELLAFHLDRQAAGDGRTAGGRATALYAWRQHGTIAATARAAGISRSTARTWLKQLGIPTTREDT